MANKKNNTQNEVVQALQKCEELYRKMIEASLDAVVVHDGERVLYVNSVGLKMIGAKDDSEVVGRSIFDFVPPAFRDYIKKRAKAGSLGKQLPPIQEKMTRLDGRELDIEVTGFPFDFAGKNASLLMIRDISFRKSAEESVIELAETRAAYEELFDYLPIGVYKNTPGSEGKFLEVNPAMLKIFEAESKDELMKIMVRDLYQDPGQRKKFSDKLMNEGVVEGEELRLRTLKGREIWGAVSAVVKKDLAGQIYFYGTFQEITMRKNVEKIIRVSEQKFRSLFDSSAIGIAIVDIEGRLTEANQAMLLMLGYDEEDLKNRSIEQITHPEDYPKDLEMIKQLLAGKIPSYTLEKRYIRKDGKLVWGRLTSSVVKDDDGNFLYGLAMLENIDEQKMVESDLQDRLNELERLNKLMIGRELKMMEIKKDLNRLKDKSN